MAEKKGTAGSPPVGFDLGSIPIAASSDEGAWLDPVHPSTGEILPMRLLVHGEDSKAFGRAMNRIQDLRARSARARRKPQDSFDDIQNAELILASHLVSQWEGLLENGVEQVCDKPTKRRILDENRWLAEQVVEFARSRGNFIPS